MLEHNHIPEMVQEIRRGKALARIVESATVTDASGNVVELANLRPDGTVGEPGDEPGDETVDEPGDETVETVQPAEPVAGADEPTTPAARL
jgi:trigger factor